MTATLIMEVLCVAGVLFMIRFLVALFTDGKSKSHYSVVCRPSWPSQGEHRARSPRIGTRHPAGFQVIVGSTNSPVRRAG